MAKFAGTEESNENLDRDIEGEKTPKPKKTGLSRKEFFVILSLLAILLLIVGKILFNRFYSKALIPEISSKISRPVGVLNPAPVRHGVSHPNNAVLPANPAKPYSNAKKENCKKCDNGSAAAKFLEKPYRGKLSDLFVLPKNAAANNNSASPAGAAPQASQNTPAVKTAAPKSASVKVVGIASGYCILKIDGALYYAREGEIIDGIEILHIRSKSVRIMENGKSELIGVSQ